MNNSNLSDGEGDLFGMELHYNTQDGSLNNAQLYNGNISAMKWSDQDGAGAGISERAYSFGYDKLNRLTTANHFENSGATGKHSVSGLNYDLNGNIIDLKRNEKVLPRSWMTLTIATSATSCKR